MQLLVHFLMRWLLRWLILGNSFEEEWRLLWHPCEWRHPIGLRLLAWVWNLGVCQIIMHYLYGWVHWYHWIHWTHCGRVTIKDSRWYKWKFKIHCHLGHFLKFVKKFLIQTTFVRERFVPPLIFPQPNSRYCITIWRTTRFHTQQTQAYGVSPAWTYLYHISSNVIVNPFTSFPPFVHCIYQARPPLDVSKTIS